ncbi:MAG TPA: transposase [Candidatus Sumerlaeota bacterium]|nr:transposase [Candidatus Sumerlaeota bacterium]HOR26800.1 transposase [Candidatus Sumerlaeota bacterium]HPK01458.1 transposase [Candidatus Sumerlaeota bacterium]
MVREMNGIALCIGGTEDHVHIYAKMHQDFSVSTMLRTIKSKSSGWVHRTIPELGEFQWQNGYACFTVSQSGDAKLACYIQRQEIHHHARSFRDELIALLKAHRVEFREAFLQ